MCYILYIHSISQILDLINVRIDGQNEVLFGMGFNFSPIVIYVSNLYIANKKTS